MKSIQFFLALVFVALIVNACDKDDDSMDCMATYDADVKAIIDRSCAYSGCHSGTDAGMFVSDISKDYTSYEGMRETLFNGAFVTRSLDSLNMPPFYAPDGNPKELTASEQEILRCWAENGFPES